MGDAMSVMGGHTGALAALTALLGTAPAPGLPEGLYYPGQLVKFATAAGLVVESTSTAPTLEDLMSAARARLRARFGEPPADDVDADGASRHVCTPESEADTAGREVCPEPGFEDVAAVARLRDRLASALRAPEAAECREQLAAMAIDLRLIPGLTSDGRLTVRAVSEDFVPLLAAKLLEVCLRLEAGGLRDRLRRCNDPACFNPFIDRSAAGHGLYCTRRCASRVRARRRRERDQPIG